jgi:hypothetical protein
VFNVCLCPIDFPFNGKLGCVVGFLFLLSRFDFTTPMLLACALLTLSLSPVTFTERSGPQYFPNDKNVLDECIEMD